jgi:crotonobetainyl-CoA:carnitine CoA-transferase CaiB-like acyl-CoA transferase
MTPLDGIRIVDLTRVVAGPFCTMLLGDMGAEVLKIEEPQAGDETRGWGPFVHGVSSYYLALNRNKKSVALDLRRPDDAAALRQLVASADVLVENFKPGSLAQLGFGYPEMSALNPRLVYCSISGYGQTGPCAHLPGYDVIIQGEAGLMEMTGAADGDPMRVGVAVADYLTGLYAAQGILLALYERVTSGRGQSLDIALFDAMLSVMRLPLAVLLATGVSPARVGNEHLTLAPYEPLRARDGPVIVAVANPRLWRSLCEAIERPELAADPRFTTSADRVRHRLAMRQEIEAVFGGWSVDEVIARLERHGVPCGRVRKINEVIAHPQVAAREILRRQHHAQVGDIWTLGSVINLSRTPADTSAPPPALGEHTAEVLSELGISAGLLPLD